MEDLVKWNELIEKYAPEVLKIQKETEVAMSVQHTYNIEIITGDVNNELYSMFFCFWDDKLKENARHFVESRNTVELLQMLNEKLINNNREVD